ncbi:hypothetical protein BJ912DRAFT_960633 [Pholiota molesta]|nr:hypothetical protein BJ912DRAFT_960633 [Pholiota molesta]
MGGAAPLEVFDPIKDLPSMKGKVCYASLQHLSRMGANAYKAVPHEERTQKALERAEREGREPGSGTCYGTNSISRSGTTARRALDARCK